MTNSNTLFFSLDITVYILYIYIYTVHIRRGI